MGVGRIAGNGSNAAAESGLIDRNVGPVQETLAPESLPKKDAQCSVQISDEGYRRWELSQENKEQEAATVQQTEGAQPLDVTAEEEEPKDRMERLQIFLDAHNDVFIKAKPKPTKDTDDEKVAALEELRQLKEEQEAEYRKMEAQAQELARKRTKRRNMVEKGMRELTIMLESFKTRDEEPKKKVAESKQKEDEQQDKVLQRKEEERGPDTKDAMLGLNREIRRHAFHGELSMDTTIDRIYKNLQQNFSVVREQDHVLKSGLENLYYLLQQNELSEEDRDAAVDQYIKDGKEPLHIMKENMGMGLERLKNLRTIRLGLPESQNMTYASRSQQEIAGLADLYALDELYQDSFKQLEDESLEELAEHIRELYEQERTPEAKAEQTKIEEEHKQEEQTEPISAEEAVAAEKEEENE